MSSQREMVEADVPDDDFFDYQEDFDCPHCDDGVLLVCCDDMCQGQGWCMHGDGEVICPHCNGTGALQQTAGKEG